MNHADIAAAISERWAREYQTSDPMPPEAASGATHAAITAAQAVIDICGPDHIFELRYNDHTGRDGWGLLHPITCRPEITSCPVQLQVCADGDDGMFPEPGRYVLSYTPAGTLIYEPENA